MDRPTCKTCPYFLLSGPDVADDDDTPGGDCLRYPPRADGGMDDGRIVWSPSPLVSSDSWCGEHPAFSVWLAAQNAKKT